MARRDSAPLVIGMLAILCVIVFGYSAYRIQSNDRRWGEFQRYVEARDARWERYIDRTDASLRLISERLSRIEGKR